MSTAVDTNILLDILAPSGTHVESSIQAIATSLAASPIVVSEPVYAELAGRFAPREKLDEFLDDLGVRMQPSSPEALYLAGKAWQQYLSRRYATLTCPSCGAATEARCPKCHTVIAPRQHALADFLIGAHALVHAGRLLTRDRGYYRTYFPELVLG